MTFHVPEKIRVRTGSMGTDKTIGNYGQFSIRSMKLKRPLLAQAAEGYGWEHVSVSIPVRCPTWEEMAFVKSLFRDPDDLVVQLHPPESEYVNNHQYCLHLWRKCGTNDFCELPPTILVGVRGVEIVTK